MNEVTQLLKAIEHGDPQAADQLLPLVYDELRRLAARKLSSEAPGQTLQPTALVHEAWLRLASNGDQSWDSRGHFFAAAEAMRRILVESVRRKRSLKKGGGRAREELQAHLAAPEPVEDLLALDEALNKLAGKEPLKADLVKLRFFDGMTIEEAAAALGISPATAKRYWTYSRTWLYQEISGEQAAPERLGNPDQENPNRVSQFRRGFRIFR